MDQSPAPPEKNVRVASQLGVSAFVSTPSGERPYRDDDPRQAVVGREEGRVLHAERLEDPLAQELIEGLSGCDLDDPPERVDAGEPAVAPLGAGLEVERRAAQLRNMGGEVLARVPRRDAVGFA